MITLPDETTVEGRRELFEIEIEKCKEILGDIFKDYTSIWDIKDKDDKEMPEEDYSQRHQEILQNIAKLFMNADTLLKNKNDWDMKVVERIEGDSKGLRKWTKRRVLYGLGRGNLFSILSIYLMNLDDTFTSLIEKIKESPVMRGPSDINHLELACQRLESLMSRKNIAMGLYDRGRFEVLIYILMKIIKKVPRSIYETIQVPNLHGGSYNRVQSLSDEIYATDPITDHSVQYSDVIIQDLQDLIVEIILSLNEKSTAEA